MEKVRIFLFVAALFSSWGIWPSLARWSWGRPIQVMDFSDYVKQGAVAPWVELRNVYVDYNHEVRTKLTRNGRDEGYAGSYAPLRAGPDDPRPVKVFLKPGYAVPDGDLLHQASIVRGARLFGREFPDDLAKALGSCSVPTDKEGLILLEHNLSPLSTGGAIGMLAIPASCLAGIVLTFRKRKKPPVEASPIQPN